MLHRQQTSDPDATRTNNNLNPQNSSETFIRRWSTREHPWEHSISCAPRPKWTSKSQCVLKRSVDASCLD
eukprot:13402864-Alexandrium_andersonii.AAC.1